jgi:hypothetical protein
VFVKDLENTIHSRREFTIAKLAFMSNTPPSYTDIKTNVNNNAVFKWFIIISLVNN